MSPAAGTSEVPKNESRWEFYSQSVLVSSMARTEGAAAAMARRPAVYFILILDFWC